MNQKLKDGEINGLDQTGQRVFEVDGKFKVVTTPLELFTNPFFVRRKDKVLHMLVKFTEPKFALNLADSLSLATPEFYRKMKSWDGRVDDQEATIETKIPRWITINDTPVWCTSFSESYNAGWLCCVSNLQNNADGDRLRNHFFERGLWSFTILRTDPARFALQLGIDFGRLCLEKEDICGKLQDTAEDIADYGKLLSIVYGSVLYVQDRAEFLKKCPLEYRGMLSHFVKGVEFEIQREYRCLILGWGEPQCPQILLPISNELRNLFGFTGNNVIPGGSLLPIGQKLSV